MESSSKCASIEKYLGPEYKCIASNGHIRVLADGLKSIDTKNNFTPCYTVDIEKKDHVKKMASIISDFAKGTLFPTEADAKANVIIATDNDREGEAIGWHICQVFDLPVETTRRIIFHEITKKAIQEAVANPGVLNMNLVYAAIARQVLDVLVGFKVSPLLWKYVAHGSGLSAGRCQTPALRLVYENDSERDVNGTITHYMQGCFFPPHNIMLTLERTAGSTARETSVSLERTAGSFDEESAMVEFINASATFKHTFELGAKRQSERAPPKPLNTSAILQLASNVLKMGAKETMACCQTLYQLGHITYMRTDNRTYSPEFIKTATKYISDNWSERHVSNTMPVNTDASNPHEAIRVTNILLKDLVIIDKDGSNNRLERLYKLIWTNTVQSCMAPAIINVLPISVNAPFDNVYKGNVEVPQFLGYKIVEAKGGGEAKGNETKGSDANAINALILKSQTSKSREVAFTYLQSVPTMEHKGKPHYTEASLINKLEDLGIGRPSTYSTIIDTIQTRKYVEKADVPGTKVGCNIYTLRQYDTNVSVETVEKTFGAEHGKLVLEPVGKLVVEFLLDKFDALFSYDFTKKMEESLDQVAAGALPWYKVCEECNKQINQLVNALAKLEKKVYAVEGDWILLFSKDGAKLVNQVTKEFKSIKYGLKLDLNKLDRGEYALDDLVQTEQRDLGNGIIVKSGKFGLYAEIHKDDSEHATVSLNYLRKPIEEIVLGDILVPSDSGNKSVLRVLTPELSVRNGKYGPYIYYQTTKMKKPKFYDLKGFDQGFGVCDADELIAWIRAKHGLKV